MLLGDIFLRNEDRAMRKINLMCCCKFPALIIETVSVEDEC